MATSCLEMCQRANIPSGNRFPHPRSTFGTRIAIPNGEYSGHFMADSATIQLPKRQSKSPGQFDMQIPPPVAWIADCDFPVLIEGEHGVGKRSISAQIHAQSHRSRMMLTELNSCDADPAELEMAFSHKGTVY